MSTLVLTYLKSRTANSFSTSSGSYKKMHSSQSCTTKMHNTIDCNHTCMYTFIIVYALDYWKLIDVIPRFDCVVCQACTCINKLQ